MTAVAQLSALPIVHALGWTLLHFLWQGALIALLLACMLTVVPVRASQLRYAAACTAMALMVALPLITFAVLTAKTQPETQQLTTSPAAQSMGPALNSALTPPAEPWGAECEAALNQSLPLVTVFWFAGVILLLCRLYLGVMATGRMRTLTVEPAPAELNRILQSIRGRLHIERTVELMYSARVQTPSVIGSLKPLILIPVGCMAGLSAVQVEALFAHELAHIRRHDSLVNLLQSMVETVLFYHPAVWWVSGSMRRERENCCDDLAVAVTGDRVAYAKALSLLEAMRAPMPTQALAASGGVLKARIARLLGVSRLRVFPRLAAMILLVLAGTGAAVAVLEVAHAQSAADAAKTGANPSFSFEVVSIRPNHSPQSSGYVGMRVPGSPGIPKDRFTATNVPTGMLIGWAFGRDSSEAVSGGPSWINSEHYDIDAKLKDSEAAALEKLSGPDRLVQMKLMVQSLLADRFGLEVKHTTGTQPVYALVIAKGGPKLQETVPGSTSPINVQGHPVQFLQLHGELRVHGLAVSDLARWLWLQEGDLGRPVLDQTGLKGKYDFDLKWTPDAGTETAPPDTSGPSIFTAIQEQLGLKLESTTGPKESVVIVHIEKPSEN
jgi:uncharacterized protein (TIGR03435 family)